MNKKFLSAAFTLSGTMIGAGILGLPYVFAQSGFFIGIFWLFLLGIVMFFAKNYLAEVTLRTKTDHQLVGYARRYLGKKGGRLMLIAMVVGIYSALLAYMIGEGQSLSNLFTGSGNLAIYFAVGFWLFMAILLKEGLRGLRKVETWGVFAIILVVLAMFFMFFPQIRTENLIVANNQNFFLPFGVVLFSLMGFSAIPSVRKELRKQEKNMKKAIYIGVLIPIVLYIIFTVVVVGDLGSSVSQVATISFGKILNLLGVFTILTSYFVLSFALKDMFREDLRISKRKTFIYVSIVPLFIYLVAVVLKLGFVNVLGVGGTISGGLSAILIVFMNKKAKQIGKREPEFSMPINWLIIALISLVFIAGTVFTFLY